MQSHEVSVATMQTRRAQQFRRVLFPYGVASLLVLVALGVNARGQDPVETIRIDSDLVDLRVSVLGASAAIATPLLQQKDFVVLEDG